MTWAELRKLAETELRYSGEIVFELARKISQDEINTFFRESIKYRRNCLDDNFKVGGTDGE